MVDDFALQALEVFQRHIQKIATAAGRVQHAGGAQLVVKPADFGAGFDEGCLGFGQRGFEGVEVALGVVAVVDVLFAAERVVLEVDGWAAHGGREAFENDRRRQNRLTNGQPAAVDNSVNPAAGATGAAAGATE